jgi:hypothetical protein
MSQAADTYDTVMSQFHARVARLDSEYRALRQKGEKVGLPKNQGSDYREAEAFHRRYQKNSSVHPESSITLLTNACDRIRKISRPNKRSEPGGTPSPVVPPPVSTTQVTRPAKGRTTPPAIAPVATPAASTAKQPPTSPVTPSPNPPPGPGLGPVEPADSPPPGSGK